MRGATPSGLSTKFQGTRALADCQLATGESARGMRPWVAPITSSGPAPRFASSAVAPLKIFTRGRSSAGRARASQARGRGFETRLSALVLVREGICTGDGRRAERRSPQCIERGRAAGTGGIGTRRSVRTSFTEMPIGKGTITLAEFQHELELAAVAAGRHSAPGRKDPRLPEAQEDRNQQPAGSGMDARPVCRMGHRGQSRGSQA